MFKFRGQQQKRWSFFNTFVQPLLNNPVRVVRGTERECYSLVSETSRSGSSLTVRVTHSRTVRMEQPLVEGRRARVRLWMPTGAPTSGVEAAHAAPSPGHPRPPVATATTASTSALSTLVVSLLYNFAIYYSLLRHEV